MNTILKILAASVAVIGGLALAALIVGLPVMLLWNWLVPQLFGLKEITFAQAIGLCILFGLLFKSSSSSVTK